MMEQRDMDDGTDRQGLLNKETLMKGQSNKNDYLKRHG